MVLLRPRARQVERRAVGLVSGLSADYTIIGLDLSVSSTGIADASGTRTAGYSVKKDAHWSERAIRLQKLGVIIDRALKGADLAVIEAPAYGQSNAGHTLGELHGVVKVILIQRGIPAAFPTSQQLKQFACDHGNAPKDAVLAAAIRDGSPARNFDEADAWWLRRMGVYRYRADLYQALPQYRRRVLDRIVWPRLNMKEAVGG